MGGQGLRPEKALSVSNVARLAVLLIFALALRAPRQSAMAQEPLGFRLYLPLVRRDAPSPPLYTAQQQAMALAINSARTARGLAPLQLVPALFIAAQGHTEVMAAAACLEHQCAGEASLGDRISAAGYAWTACAETIAGASYDDGEAILALWLASDGHRAILLDPALRDLGIGYAYSPLDGRHYWTADLAVPAG